MKKNEKRGVIISVLVMILGIVGLIYTPFVEKSVEVGANMYSFGIAYLILGLMLLIYFIRLSKNKKRSEEQENIFLDERINANREKSFAITFKIIIWTSIIANYIVTFFLRQYQEFANALQNFTSIAIIIYLIVYYFVSKNN